MTSKQDRIFLSPPHQTGEELKALKQVLDSNWLAPLGPAVNAFEAEVSDFIGVDHAAALSSGTAAIHLALILAGAGPGKKVLCPTLTFAASAFPILYVGASPVFLDVDRTSWTLCIDQLQRELKTSASRNELPVALITVDLYGQCCDYDSILDLCDHYGVAVVEDAAEALGSRWNGRQAGGFGRFGVVSFNGNKIITTSGGGMLLSEDGEAVAKARFLASQARDPAPHYQHSTVGFNYRMSNLLASVGRVQFRALEERVSRRRAIFELYRESLQELPGIEFMPEVPACRSNRWLTCVTVDPSLFRADREDLRSALEGENIEARPVWKPMHLQPVFSRCRYSGGGNSETLFKHGLCLPSGSALRDEDVSRICQTIKKVHLEKR